jgi:phage head maturation protease
MSFAFHAKREEWDDTGETPKRTLLEVEVGEVSAVQFPAYEGTEIALRSLRSADASLHNSIGAQARVRMKRNLLARKGR